MAMTTINPQIIGEFEITGMIVRDQIKIKTIFMVIVATTKAIDIRVIFFPIDSIFCDSSIYKFLFFIKTERIVFYEASLFRVATIVEYTSQVNR